MSSEDIEQAEEQLRAAYEAEMGRITSVEMIVQAAASLLNIGARRLGLTGPQGDQPSRQDLDQVRDAIDAVRGLLPVLERSAPTQSRPLREALSQLQMAYAREAQPPPGTPGTQNRPAGTSPGGPNPQGDHTGDQKDGPGPAEASGRLWVPGR